MKCVGTYQKLKKNQNNIEDGIYYVKEKHRLFLLFF